MLLWNNYCKNIIK